jgi:hypothetical protein
VEEQIPAPGRFLIIETALSVGKWVVLVRTAILLDAGANRVAGLLRKFHHLQLLLASCRPEIVQRFPVQAVTVMVATTILFVVIVVTLQQIRDRFVAKRPLASNSDAKYLIRLSIPTELSHPP